MRLQLSVHSGADPGGRCPPLKPKKVTLFTMILYNSENTIRNVIRKTVSVIRRLPNITEITPPNRTAGSAPVSIWDIAIYLEEPNKICCSSPAIGINVRGLPLLAVAVSCITCRDVCVQQLHDMRQNGYFCNLKWIFKDMLPCYCDATKVNSGTIRCWRSKSASAAKGAD